MKPKEVEQRLGDTPYMRLDQGEEISRFILENNVRNILELGFAHGASTCYMAAALAEAGGGSIVTIDLERARTLKPSMETSLAKCGLQDTVTVYYEQSSYNWRLMRFLEADPMPRFDFCYLDGAHSWETDGFAFFLVDRLLKPDGWILFDDLEFTWESLSPKHGHERWFKSIPRELRVTPQVRKVYDLLVKNHPGYGDFRLTRNGWWVYARKLSNSTDDRGDLRRETLHVTCPLEIREKTVYVNRYVYVPGVLRETLQRIVKTIGLR